MFDYFNSTNKSKTSFIPPQWMWETVQKLPLFLCNDIRFKWQPTWKRFHLFQLLLLKKIAESLATFKFVVLISFINAVNKVRRHTLLHCININTRQDFYFQHTSEWTWEAVSAQSSSYWSSKRGRGESSSSCPPSTSATCPSPRTRPSSRTTSPSPTLPRPDTCVWKKWRV